ncbi:MAG: hypothetical protein ABF506_04760 [Zymomonas mobilis]
MDSLNQKSRMRQIFFSPKWAWLQLYGIRPVIMSNRQNAGFWRLSA